MFFSLYFGGCIQIGPYAVVMCIAAAIKRVLLIVESRFMCDAEGMTVAAQDVRLLPSMPVCIAPYMLQHNAAGGVSKRVVDLRTMCGWRHVR